MGSYYDLKKVGDKVTRRGIKWELFSIKNTKAEAEQFVAERIKWEDSLIKRYGVGGFNGKLKKRLYSIIERKIKTRQTFYFEYLIIITEEKGVKIGR
jgi:hypothetical protein